MFGMLDQDRYQQMSRIKDMIKKLANQEKLTKEEVAIMLMEEPDLEEDNDADDYQEMEEAEEIHLKLWSFNFY